jgi:hypothetical protein
MDLHRLYVLTPQVRGKEGLGGCVTVNEDRVIADRTGQDVGDRIEDRASILLEEEGRVARAELIKVRGISRG